jgi:hypothetical protein
LIGNGDHAPLVLAVFIPRMRDAPEDGEVHGLPSALAMAARTAFEA